MKIESIVKVQDIFFEKPEVIQIENKAHPFF